MPILKSLAFSTLLNVAAGVLLPLCYESILYAEPQGPALQPFAPAVVVSGTTHERGAACGKQFKQAIHKFLENEVYRAFIGKPFSKEEMLKYAAACEKVSREECPMLVEECEGIAEGAEVTIGEVMLTSLHEELRQLSSKRFQGHCTAVATAPADSGDGHTYVGQTWDFMMSVAGDSSIIEWQRKDGPSVLSYCFPGQPVGAGMNSNGIALCWTSAIGKVRPRVGIPSYMLVGHLLAQNSLEKIIEVAKHNKQAGYFTFVVADDKGNLLNIEGSPEDVAVEQPKSHLARAYFGSRKMTGAKPDKPAELNPRCQLMYDMLSKTKGKNDLGTIQRYFTEVGNGIAFGDPNATGNTIDVMVFDTTARKGYFSRGAVFGVEWREFGFSSAK